MALYLRKIAEDRIQNQDEIYLECGLHGRYEKHIIPVVKLTKDGQFKVAKHNLFNCVPNAEVMFIAECS